MTGKDFDTLNEAYRTKVSEGLPALAVRALAPMAVKKAGQELSKRFKKEDEEVEEAKHEKPDYLDFDKDGNKKEPMKKALKDKKKKKPINAAHCNEKATDQRPKDEVKADDIQSGSCDQVHDDLQEPVEGVQKEEKKSKKTAKESINNSNKGNIMSDNKSTFDELYESVMSEDEDFELGLPSEGEHDELELGDDDGDEGGDVTVTLSPQHVECLREILGQVGGGDGEGDEDDDPLNADYDKLNADYDKLNAGAHESAEVTEEEAHQTGEGKQPGHTTAKSGHHTEPAADSLGGKTSGTGDASYTDEEGSEETGEGKQPGHHHKAGQLAKP